MTVQKFIKIVWTFVEKCESFIEKSGEKKGTIAEVVKNVFRLLKTGMNISDAKHTYLQ